MQKSTFVAAVCGLVLFHAAQARAGDFFDTRLSFVFADDNVLARAGETTPNSPDAHFGGGAQNTQFYDNFNTRFSGFETLSHVVLYKKAPTFFEGLTAEAALSILLLEQSSGAIGLRDDSSYIRLNYRPSSWGAAEGISLTGFPVSADRFRLGYAYRITWGGNDIFTTGAQSDGVPGVKLQLTRNNWYAFVGMKTGLLLNQLIQEKETVYGVLGGAGIDATPFLRIEANGGYFQKGYVPDLASQGIRAPVNSAGISAEAVYHVGAPVGTSVDLQLYRNDPEREQRFFAPEVYNPGGPPAYTLSLEGSVLSQTLEDPDVFARTKAQRATAIAFQGRMKINYLRAHVLSLYRSISFIQFNVPGFPPFKDFPAGTTQQPEFFVAGGVDYHLPMLHLTPGIIAGVQRPASFKTPQTVLGGNTPPAGLVGSRTVVVRDVNQLSILPTNYDALPIYSVKTTFRLDLGEYVAAIGEVYYTKDPNRTSFKDDVTGIAQPSFEKEDQLGFNVILQARF